MPNRADVEDYLALTAGTTTLDELVQRYRDQATARRAADRASAPAARG